MKSDNYFTRGIDFSFKDIILVEFFGYKIGMGSIVELAIN